MITPQRQGTTSYRVRWDIDVDDVPVELGAPEAARRAFAIMQTPRDPSDADAAVVFDVIPVDDYDGDWHRADSIDLACLAEPPEPTLVQADGIVWCTVHHGVRDDTTTVPYCDMRNPRLEVSAVPCAFHLLYYCTTHTPCLED